MRCTDISYIPEKFFFRKQIKLFSQLWRYRYGLQVAYKKKLSDLAEINRPGKLQRLRKNRKLS